MAATCRQVVARQTSCSLSVQPLAAISSSRRSVASRPGSVSRKQVVQVKAIGGGPDNDKKTLTREQEPDQYWVSAGEKKGANPLKDPLAIIGILAILFPFLFLLLAIGLGWVDTSVYR
eukprot:jgi/Chrzof1/10138/Cz04g30100.t1